MQDLQGRYVPPELWDLGGLADVTATGYAMLGVAGVQDMGFSAPPPGPGGGGNGGNETAVVQNVEGPADGGAGGPSPNGDAGDAQEVADRAGSGGGEPEPGGGGSGGGSGSGSGSGSGGGGSGGGGGGDGKLPFTGLEAGVVAAVGAALTGAGEALRRVVRGRRRS
jgi:hypothetical protein